MNTKYICVIALLGMFLVQGTSALPREADRDVIEDLVKIVKEAIDKLVQEASEIVNKAIKALQDLIDQISEEAGPIIAQLKEAIENKIKEMKDEINKVVEKAQNLGIDIEDCVKDESDDFKKIANDIMNAEIACVQTEIDTGMKMCNDAIQVIKDQVALIKDMPDKVTGCMNEGGVIAAMKCLTNLAIEVAQTEKDLPGKVAGMVLEAKKFVSGMEVRLGVCASTGLVNASVEIAKLGGEIVECCVNKMKEHEH